MTLNLFLSVYGATFVLVESWIFKHIRDILSFYPFFKELLSCFFCTGFWCGLIVSILAVEPIPTTKDWVSLSCAHFLNGLAGATFSYTLNTVLMALESVNNANRT